MTVVVSNVEKDALWKSYHDRRPTRVPVVLATNNRVLILDPRFNRDGLDYERMFSDPQAMLLAQLRWQELARTHYHRFCDYQTGLPDKWDIGVHFQNVSEAWFFGCPVEFRPDQVPDTKPILAEDNKHSIFDTDISRPLDAGPWKRGIEFTHRMTELAQNMDFNGRPVSIQPFVPSGSDGPLTVALKLRGGDFLTDILLDPEYADRLLAFIVEAAVIRIRAFHEYWGRQISGVWFADDSIETIGTDMYVEKILPHHRRFYDAFDPEGKLPRSMHLCGDAGRHFPVIAEKLGISSFDTGFPVDLAWLRRELGPNVEIYGGVEVGLIMNGTPQQVYERARAILTCGVLDGGRFVLREANNLPPAAPEAALAAMYRAAFDFGSFT